MELVVRKATTGIEVSCRIILTECNGPDPVQFTLEANTVVPHSSISGEESIAQSAVAAVQVILAAFQHKLRSEIKAPMITGVQTGLRTLAAAGADGVPVEQTGAGGPVPPH